MQKRYSWAFSHSACLSNFSPPSRSNENVEFMLINVFLVVPLYLSTHACSAGLQPNLFSLTLLNKTNWCWCFTFHITNNGITVNMKMTKPTYDAMPFLISFVLRSLLSLTILLYKSPLLVTSTNPSFTRVSLPIAPCL
jgi:hypothetical protein